MKKQNGPDWEYEKPELIEVSRGSLAFGDAGGSCADVEFTMDDNPGETDW